MKKRSFFSILFRIFGMLIFLLGVRMFGEGIYHYIEEHNQKDWIPTTAYVVDVSSQYSGSRHYNSVKYDITYQYEVEGRRYSDILYNRNRAMRLGDPVEIKYDPNAPEYSTDLLAPSLKNLILFSVFGGVFLIIGFFLSGARSLICKRSHQKGKTENEKLTEKEATKGREKARQRIFLTIICRIVMAAVVLGGIMLATKRFPGIQPIGTDRFMEVMREEGYTTVNTTEELKQSWKVGSMLEEAVSLRKEYIRMDFAVMDTAESAEVLLNSMVLPVTDGETQEQNGMVYEWYSVENQTLYTAKIRIRDTVIYISAQAEYKAEAEKLLEKLGYWDA